MNKDIIDKLHKSKYYIYEHYLDGKLFYIGKGTKERAINFSNRSKAWKIKVNNRETDIEIKVIAHFYDNLYAEAFEKMHIQNAIKANIELVNIVYNDNFISYNDFKISSTIKNADTNFEYKSKHIKRINNAKQLELIIIDFKNNYVNKTKGIIYSENIKSMKTIEIILKAQGFNPLSIWSINNEDNILTKEQVKSKSELIATGKIPEPYDFLIFNQSLFNQLYLKDDSIEFIAINLITEEVHQYVRTLVKKDIDVFVYRTKEEVFIKIDLDEKYLNKSLTADMKSEICLKLNIVNSYRRIEKWTTISKRLKQQGYFIKDKHETINGKK